MANTAYAQCACSGNVTVARRAVFWAGLGWAREDWGDWRNWDSAGSVPGPLANIYALHFVRHIV